MLPAMTVVMGLVLAATLAMAGETGKGNDNQPVVKRDAGLVAHYFKDPTEWDGNWKEGQKPTVDAVAWTFREYKFSRIEPLVNHWFIRRGWFSVRWVGSIDLAPWKAKDATKKDGETDLPVTLGQPLSQEPVEVEFDFWADDGARLFIELPDANGVVKLTEVINDWRNCSEVDPESHRKAKVKLGPGTHKIVIEYFQGESLQKDDKDPCKLGWTCEALKMKHQIIPASQFSHTDADLQDFVPSTSTPDQMQNVTPVIEGGGANQPKDKPKDNK